MKALLMFEFTSLPVIAAVNEAMAKLGAEVIPVQPKDYNKPLQSLLEKKAAGADHAGGLLGGQMLVLCGLDAQLEDVLAALRGAGVGLDCLKAVLTKHNKNWNAAALYRELREERLAVTGK